MKQVIIRISLTLIAGFAFCMILSAQKVMPGIEVLRQNGFEQLKGERVGLITNPTGVDSQLKSTVDILHEAPEVNLVTLFAPEHGVRGDQVAGASFAATTDAVTGLKVFSLYGATRKPTPEMLRNVDALVYDIQDIGCRSYTFISTMGLAMEQCAALGKEFMVLDRPNPLGGYKVEGTPVTEKQSFVNQFPIPYLYGLTPGELARMLVDEGMIKTERPLKLTIIPMKGWKRTMLYSDTGLPWVLPSPHIPTAVTSMFYPATGILGELDWASIGVGYTIPFRCVSAPWVNSVKLANRLNGLKLPGLLFRPVNFKAFYAFGKGLYLGGVECFITDFEASPVTLVQFYVMQEMASLWPDHKPQAASASKLQMFDKVTSRKLREAFFARFRVEDMEKVWNAGVADFKLKSEKYYLYD